MQALATRSIAMIMLGAFVLASGCLGGDNPSNLGGNADQPAKKGNVTDTIYFMGPGEMSAQKPNGTTPIATAETTTIPIAADQDVIHWEYTFNNNATIGAFTAVIFFRANEATLQPGPVFVTWRLEIDGNAQANWHNGQAQAPGPVQGEFQVQFGGNLNKLEKKPGDTITFDLRAWTSSTTAHPTLEVLTGASNYASHFKAKALNETVPA